MAIPTSEIVLIITTIAGPIIAWFVARKKAIAEAQGHEIENVERVITIYKRTADDLEKNAATLGQRLLDVQGEIVQLRADLELERKRNADLMHSVDLLRTECNNLRTELERQRRSNADLKNKLANLTTTLKNTDNV